jgi:peptidoglycan hydrolase-like protein with peptidoglycan-binding domain
MKITKKYLMKIINEETSIVLREKRPKIKFTRGQSRRGKRQLELYKTLGTDFRGSQRTAVKTHQNRLVLLGWGFMMPKTTDGDGLDPDGIYGPETMKATAAFQKSVGLTPDGLWGRDSEGKMGQVLNGDLKPNAPERVIRHLTNPKAQGGMGVEFVAHGAGGPVGGRATDVGRRGGEIELSDQPAEFGRALGAFSKVPDPTDLEREIYFNDPPEEEAGEWFPEDDDDDDDDIPGV